jgi:hypothetical protein
MGFKNNLNELAGFTKRFLKYAAYAPQNLNNILQIQIDEYLNRHLHNNPKYDEQGKLNKFEFQVFSQNGEDGIIEEIFKRIGETNKFFAEIACGNGLENNSAYLIHKGWNGLWIDGNIDYIEKIRTQYLEPISSGRLTVTNALVTAENIEELLSSARTPKELDLLTIDVDGNDFHLWRAINEFRPRVLIIEYNAMFPPTMKWVMDYSPTKKWSYTSHFGASLKSLEILGIEKGYSLVACCFSGVNAFFIRNDVLQDIFAAPYTAEHHYEPPRYFLKRKLGFEREF